MRRSHPERKEKRASRKVERRRIIKKVSYKRPTGTSLTAFRSRNGLQYVIQIQGWS